jgi:hypothetical protein
LTFNVLVPVETIEKGHQRAIFVVWSVKGQSWRVLMDSFVGILHSTPRTFQRSDAGVGPA